MSDKQKHPAENEAWSRLVRRMKEDPTSRAIAIVSVVLILALSVLITVTVIANRAKKQNPGDETTGAVTTAGDTTKTPDTDASVTEPVDKPVDALPTSFLLPVEGVLYKKHDATAQVFSNTMQDYRVHLGIDVATAEDAPVCAAAAGTVERVWEDVRYGQCVAIKHSGDAMTVYKNLSLTLAEGITEGAKLSAGALIGTVGDTAMVEIADEPHLHFEMTVKGLSVDPLDYFDASALASLSVDTAYEG